jgi:intracellular sulfur oxidation DsrE/DsrF family protein
MTDAARGGSPTRVAIRQNRGWSEQSWRRIVKPTILARRCAVMLALLSTSAGVAAAEVADTGPVIEKFGPVYDVVRPDFRTPTDMVYRAVFDVAPSPEAANEINPRIESVARFLNMLARAGVPQDHVQLALVVHGAAGKDMLSSPAYKARFGVENPNEPLLAALRANGVRVILCGQTAAHKGFARDELAAGVETALSAMSALVVLQSDGYRMISF